MTQYDYGTIDPNTKSGTDLAADLNSFRNALNTLHRGSARPSYAQGGMLWIDESGAPVWVINMYDSVNSVDVPLFEYNTTTQSLTPVAGAAKEVATAYAANVAIDLDAGPVHNIAQAGAMTLDLPTNGQAGMSFMINITHDGNSVSFGTGMNWPDDNTVATLDTTSGKISQITGYMVSATQARLALRGTTYNN